MLCRNPYQRGMHVYPCGQCMPCRVNRRRVWTHRMMLESLLHADNSFITLTYADENLPLTSNGLPTLNQKHLQDWLKRFRKTIAPLKLRFYGVGEYGDESGRPHYHVAAFGYPTCRKGNTAYRRVSGNQLQEPYCCSVCRTVHNTWKHGRVFVGDLTTSSAQYICGYVTKKMTKKDDPRLNGRYPEFANMSRRPGIGADAMHDIASELMKFNLEDREVDVPSALRHGNRLLPLGRYLRRRLRTLVGHSEETPDAVVKAIMEELRPVRDAAFENSESFKEALVKAADQKVRNMEAKAKVFRQRRKI